MLFNLRPGHAFGTSTVRLALLRAIDREALIDDVFGGSAALAHGLIPSTFPLYDAVASTPVPYDPEEAEFRLEKLGWKRVDGQWRLPGEDKPFTIELLSPDQASNPAAFATAAFVARSWTAFGITTKHTGLPAAEFVRERLTRGEYEAAVGDIAIGLDPDLYPLLASTQTVSGGSNVIGLQDATLDRLLVKAREPGTEAERTEAYRALQEHLTKGRYIIPLVYADETTVVHDEVVGPSLRQVSDPSDRFWDVLTWRLADDR